MSVSLPYRTAYASDGGFVIGLDLPTQMFDPLPSTVVAMGKKFIKKGEFHVTLLHTPLSTEEKLVSLFNSFVNQVPIQLTSLLRELRSQRKGDNETIVVRCEVSGIEGFFRTMNKTLGLEIPHQPAHITLYSLEYNVGLAIDSVPEMETLPQLEVPELSAILDRLDISQ